jgi:hypothetical protein
MSEGNGGLSKPKTSEFREYVLAELRCAVLRARLAALDIECAGIALRSEMIDAETALAWLRDAGALGYVAPEPSA